MRLMRLALRIAMIAVGALLLIFAAAVSLVVLKRDALMRRGLQLVASKTGAVISLGSLDLGVATSGLEIVAGDASIAYHGQSARAKRIEAVIGYGQLVRVRLLPLKSLSLFAPDVTLAPASRPTNQSFDLQGYVATLPKLASTVARFANHAVVVNGKLRLTSFKAADQSIPKVNLDASLDADSRVLSVAIERVSWNGPPIDGFSASADFTIPTLEAQQAKPAYGSVEFIRRSNVALNGRLQLAVSESAALHGQIRVHAAQVPTLGQVGFDGSYALSTDQFKLAGAVLMPAGLGLSERFPAQVAVAAQFSSNPKLDLEAGPFQVRMDEASKALGIAPTAALRGELEIERVQFAAALQPWRAAFGQCSDAACKQRQVLRALVGSSSGALSIATADLAADGTLALAEVRRLGFLSLRLEGPARFTLDNGVVAADNLAAQVGALRITRGRFQVDARQSLGSSGMRAVYSGGFFGALALDQPALQKALPVSARNVLRAQRTAYAQANFGGTLAGDNGRFELQNSWFELNHGFVELADHGAHNALVFRGRAELRHELLLSAVRASVLEGGTLAADGRLAFPSRTLRARVSLRGADLWRWYRTLAPDSSLSRFKVSGRAGGQLAVLWKVSREPPRLDGVLSINGLSVDSPYTTKPVLVRGTRVVFNRRSASFSASTVMLGASHFDLLAAVSDFANPAVKLTVSGSRFDVDAINFKGGRSGGGAQTSARAKPADGAPSQARPASSETAGLSGDSPSGAGGVSLDGSGSPGGGSAPAPPSHPLVLSGTVNLRAVFFRGIRIEDLAAQFDGRANQWEVKNFSARALRGSVKLAAIWNGDQRQLYLTGDARRIDARALFIALGAADKQPVSGELNARINAGAILAGAGRPPALSCGGATIVIANGALGKADVLTRIMELLSVRSWLTLNPPDLDKTGLPFDKIIARLRFAPRALTVQELQLSGPLVRVVGHGQMSLPDNRLDLHLAAIPFTSPRWALDKVPVVGIKLGHTFDQVFAVRVRVSGPANGADVSPELFGSVVDALVGIVELPLDFMPENTVPDAVLPPSAQGAGGFDKCAPPS